MPGTLILHFCLFVCFYCFLKPERRVLIGMQAFMEQALSSFLHQWYLQVKNERQIFILKELCRHVEITTATWRHFKWAGLVSLLFIYFFCLLVCSVFCHFFVRSGYDDSSSEGTDINQWSPSLVLYMYIATWWQRLIEKAVGRLNWLRTLMRIMIRLGWREKPHWKKALNQVIILTVAQHRNFLAY